MQAYWRDTQELDETPLKASGNTQDSQDFDVEGLEDEQLEIHPTISEHFHSNKRKKYILFSIWFILSLIGTITTSIVIALNIERNITITFLIISGTFLIISIICLISLKWLHSFIMKKISEFKNKRPITQWTCAKEEWKIFVEDEYGRNGRIRKQKAGDVLKSCIIMAIIGGIKSLTSALKFDYELAAENIGIPSYALLILIFIGSAVLFACLGYFLIFVYDEITYYKTKNSEPWEAIIFPNGIFFDGANVWGDFHDKNSENEWKIQSKCCSCSPFDCLTSVDLIEDQNIIEFSLLKYPRKPRKVIIRIPIPIGKMEEAKRVVGVLSGE